MNRVFVFALTIFFTGCVSIAQPPSLVWQHMGSLSYEPYSPGLGTSQRYVSQEGWIDVQVFGLGRTGWKLGVSDPQFAASFESTVRTDVRLFGLFPTITNLQFDAATRDIVISGSPFRTISSRFSHDGKPMISATYLTAQNGQLLKYHVSIYTASGLDVAAVAQSFIEEDLRSGHLRSGHVTPSRNGAQAIIDSFPGCIRCSPPRDVSSSSDEIDTSRLDLVDENHAEITREGQTYILDSYIVVFQRPYYILVRKSSNQPLTVDEASSIAAEYIKPRGCTTPLSRRVDLDKSNKDKTQWLIGIEC